MEWQEALVTHVNKSRQTFNLPPIDKDFQIDPNLLHTQLFKDKSKRDIFNFAKRSVSRAFSQNKQSKPSSGNLRKAQSQIVLNSNEDQGFVFGKPPISPSSSGGSVRFPKRTGRSMRDSHWRCCLFFSDLYTIRCIWDCIDWVVGWILDKLALNGFFWSATGDIIFQESLYELEV